MNQEATLICSRWRTPRAAAIAGIAFSLLLLISLVLTRIFVPSNPEDAGAWLSGNWKTVSFALHLLPFAGIAFLWFIGVLRDRMGAYEERFFSTVFFGSGLLFLAMLFASSAVAGGIMMVYGAMPAKLMDSGMYPFGRTVSYQTINVYAVKMAGVFMMSTCTLSLRIGIFPRWMAFLGYALALLLLVSFGYVTWVLPVFPLWVLLISGYLLIGDQK